MGAAWREVRDNRDFDNVIEMVKGVSSMGLEVCCTLGMLTPTQAQKLKDAGLTPLACGGGDKWPLHFYWSYLVMREGGHAAFGGVGEGMADEGVVEAFEIGLDGLELVVGESGGSLTFWNVADRREIW